MDEWDFRSDDEDDFFQPRSAASRSTTTAPLPLPRRRILPIQALSKEEDTSSSSDGEEDNVATAPHVSKAKRRRKTSDNPRVRPPRSNHHHHHSSNSASSFSSSSSSYTSSSTKHSPSLAVTASSPLSSTPKTPPRTRAGRLRAQGKHKTGNAKRKVRFDILYRPDKISSCSGNHSNKTIPKKKKNHNGNDDSDVDQEKETEEYSMPMSASHTYQSLARSPAARKKPPNNRHTSSTTAMRRRKRPTWNLDEEDEDESKPGKVTAASSFPHTKSNGPTKVTAAAAASINTVQMRTTSVSVHTVHDTVKVQQLSDELGYCCETLRTSRTASRQLEAMADLTALLSDHHRRVLLWNTQQPTKISSSGGTAPLTMLLHLAQWVHEQIVLVVPPSISSLPPESTAGVMGVAHESASPEINPKHASSGKMMAMDRTKAGRQSKTVMGQGADQKTGMATPSSPTTPPIGQGGLPASVVEAMGLVWHFLSMKCTMIHQSASATASRKLREDVLSNAPAMQCLLEMVARDPYLAMISQAHTSNKLDASNAVVSHSSSSNNNNSEPPVPSSPRSPIVKSPYCARGSGSPDPTVAGRKRKRRRLEMSSPSSGSNSSASSSPKRFGDMGFANQSDDGWSFASTESVKSTRADNDTVSSSGGSSTNSLDRTAQTERTFAKVMATIESPSLETPIGEGLGKREILARLPLLSFCRIFSGKFEGHDKSCIDDDDDDVDGHPSFDDEDEMHRNPLLRTNFLLAQSGAIPLIARATSNAALAVVRQLMNSTASNTHDAYVSWKFRTLTSLVDDACLLTDSNRLAFSTEGFVPEMGAYMLINITTVLKALLVQEKLFEDKFWGEVTVACLRSLTSLTHENEMAARDLQASTIQLDGIPVCHCLSVIVDVLYRAAPTDEDMTILCLNTLANVLESGGSWEVFTPLTVGGKKETESFLKWLTRRIVSQTKSFQDALVESSFGSLQDRHSERHLSKTENEALIVAGNAFIFLSHILVAARVTNPAYKDIMQELPGMLPATKVRFIQNTLKAFCNLYHFSVGALSLAIVAPVKKLLSELETILEK